MKMKMALLGGLALAFSIAPVSASGSGGSVGGFPTSQAPSVPRPVDRTYEAGKAIFNGKISRYRGVEFCISAAEVGAVRGVGRGTLKPFKRGPANALAAQLTDCADPARPAASFLEGADLRALVHYLDKRYALRLS